MANEQVVSKWERHHGKNTWELSWDPSNDYVGL